MASPWNLRSRSSVLAFATALVLTLLAVLTNLATGFLPESWTWSRNGLIVWGLVGFFALLSGVLAWHASIAGGGSEAELKRGLEVVRVDLRREERRNHFSERWVSVLDISLVNVGPTPIFLHEVHLQRIERHPFLNGTHLLAAVMSSAEYPVELPFAGDSLVCRISQAISPEEADRFTLIFDPQVQGMAGGRTLYVFDVSLVAGGERTEMPIGRFMIPDNSSGARFAGHVPLSFVGEDDIDDWIYSERVAMISRGKILRDRVVRENIIVDEEARRILDKLF